MTLVQLETIYHDKIYVNPDHVISVESREHAYDIAEEPHEYTVVTTVGAFGDCEGYAVKGNIDQVALALANDLRGL